MDLRSTFFALLAALLPCAPIAHAIDYPGTGVGAIPDNNATGLTISFNAAGFGQQVGDVRLQLTMTHTFVRDLTATLTSPSGVSRLIVFGRVGLRTTGAGGSADLSGTYAFSDSGKDFWATAAPLANAAIIPPGNYRTSTGAAGTVGQTNNYGGCQTSLTGAFLALSAADASGTWTLNIADLQAGDNGNVTAATLSLSPLPDIVSRNGFEVAPLGVCTKTALDFTGSGRASYVVVRNTGGGPTGAITWFIKDNDLAGVGVETSFVHGISGDFFLTGDWDGDGIADAGVWRAGAVGQFIIRLSSRPTRPLTLPFGTSGDDPTIVDDFNGDGLTDFVVFRPGATSGAVSRTLMLLNNSTVQRDFATGVNGSFPLSGDYNGDGAADIGVQSNAGGGNAAFQLFNGLSGTPEGSFTFGTPTDVIVDGNHSGNAVDDVTVIRASSGNILWNTRDGSTGIAQTQVTHGLSASDFVLGGDYDGDGLDDHAVWRASATPGQSKFVIRRSTLPATPLEVFFGLQGDYPIGNVRTH